MSTEIQFEFAFKREIGEDFMADKFSEFCN